ncbi:putative MscS family protein [Porphyridium purpureum]|uniref:Putative MscS family protein n=1 Tax=Porphyridium purpureum TaxID=35688 RepID=A0A5J4Z243_PORPP|nr:putative MscS family protein [Porphyridium purpureum]|eukprot:POR0199..scf208_2
MPEKRGTVLVGAQAALGALHIVWLVLLSNASTQLPLSWLGGLRLLGVPLARWMLALELFLALVNGFAWGVPLAIRWLVKVSGTSHTKLDDELVAFAKSVTVDAHGVQFAALVCGAAYIASLPLELEVQHALLANRWKIAVVLLVGLSVLSAAWTLLQILARGWFRSSEYAEDPANAAKLDSALTIARPLFFVCGALLLAENAGVQLESLMTSLGVGGITIALGTQTVLQDAAAAVVIFLDKPFRVGDFVVIGSAKGGTVQSIGYRTTTIRASDGELLIFSNKDVSNARISKFDAGMSRKKTSTFYLSKNIPVEALRTVPELLRSAVASAKLDVDVEFIAAYFKDTALDSHDFELLYIVKKGSYLDFLSAQSAIHLSVLDCLHTNGLPLASRQVLLEPHAAPGLPLSELQA